MQSRAPRHLALGHKPDSHQGNATDSRKPMASQCPHQRSPSSCRECQLAENAPSSAPNNDSAPSRPMWTPSYGFGGGGLSPPTRRQYSDAAQFSKSPSSYADAGGDYMGYDVVLDDGTLKKKSVSLSSLPSPALPPRPSLANIKFTETTPLLGHRHAKRPAELCDSSDDDDDDDDERSSWWRRWTDRLKWQGFTYKQKMVLKCSIAYAIGSLFTFVPWLNSLIGGATVSSHVVATVTVFFNPAKSIGGMIEATGYGLLYGCLALGLCILSMMTANYLIIEHDQYVASCLVTLLVWLGGSTFVVAFVKARMNLPSINTASSLAFIILFTILVREGSTNKKEYDTTKIESTFGIVLTGAAITTAVCLTVWPMRATRQLKGDINATLQSIRVLIKLLTKTFLLDTDLPEFMANKQLETAIKDHSASFSALEASLKEARREFFSLEMFRYADGYIKTVASLQRLAQHISGLRSSCGLQFEVMHEHEGDFDNPDRLRPVDIPKPRSKPIRSETWNVKADHHRKKIEQELRLENSLEHRGMTYFIGRGSSQPPSPDITNQVFATSVGHYPSELDTVLESPMEESPRTEDLPQEGALNQFIKSIRGPMKSLAYTCKQTIIHVQARFTGQEDEDTPSFAVLKHNLTTALQVFEESKTKALLLLYRRKLKDSRNRQRSLSHMGVGELQAQLMNQFPAEDVFLVYFFVFCMVEFTNELVCLVTHAESLFEAEKKPITLRAWWEKSMILLRSVYSRVGLTIDSTEKEQDNFVPNNNNTHDTLQTPSPTTRLRKMLQGLWSFLSWFRKHTVRYAIKAAMTAVALASLAYIPATQQYFRDLRMEWTLVTVMAVMTPTVGGTNIIAILRVLATVLGCIVAALVCFAFAGNPYFLFVLSWAFSVPCFWIILNHKYGRFGQFALLAYNLVVLYSYNRRQSMPLDAVLDLAWKRCVAVSFGVMVGLVVTAYIWPYEARTELRKGLSDLLLRLSWLYKKLASVYSDAGYGTSNCNYSQLIEQIFYDNHPIHPRKPTTEELNNLIQRNATLSAELQHIELELQLSLVELRGLLGHAPNEPRLKGPFPVATYDAMLTSCQNILDKFLSMRIVVVKETWAVQARRAFMRPASKEWMDVAGNILLYFYLLASALQLKTPLPPYLPPAEKAREALMSKLQFILTKTAASNDSADGILDDDGYMVYYAYAVLMEGIIQELEKLGELMRQLYGSLVPEDQWVRCFGLVDIEQQDLPGNPI